MRVFHFLTVVVALNVSGCASWHRPSTVFRGRPVIKPTKLEPDADDFNLNAQHVALEQPALIDSEVLNENETLTPPINRVPQRSRYRPSRSRQWTEIEQEPRDRVPINPPGAGYVELPPPPENE